MSDTHAADGYNRSALFWISVLALFTAAAAFSLRIAASGAIKEALFDPVDIANSGRMIGDALGAAFLGFAASLLVASPILDVLGAKRVILIASATFIVGPLMVVMAPSLATGVDVVPLVWWGMLVMGVGWGCTEAAINPVTAALYPDEKTHRLNVLHAWWPAGIVAGGLLSLLLFQVMDMDWRIAIAMIMIPGIAFGLWAMTQKFPGTQAESLGVSFGEMLMVVVKQPFFWVFFAIMFLTASAELAPSSWVDIALSETVKMPGIVVLVYVAAIMFVMRHFAGALAHRFSDMGLLWISTVPAGIGLYLLSVASSPVTALVAATVWAVGVCYMWPTMLAAVAHRFPKGGPWTIGLTGFAGALAIRFVLPELGGIYDKAKFEAAGGQAAFEALEPGSEAMAGALAQAATTSFQAVAIIPVILFFIFGAVWAFERSRNRKGATG
ncbi:MFS transporter [Marinihelvus fidelis]|uniref:MFS transporter n=1 Tax=Marinihelvus fidelis TaxID=2613842 RepID=A0A5N0TE31_9GAMM|nr:MFS transporter [Marinihelvus fidelis]KAA9132714.1 MFS transporter [Marinihelvus fidelis]